MDIIICIDPRWDHCFLFQYFQYFQFPIFYFRFLATGDAIQTIAISYSCGITTCWTIVGEVCAAIWEKFNSEYLPQPSQINWLQIADDFSNMWNFPNILGAIDGKHVAMQAPSHSGSEYFNYKGYHSIILLAMCDAQYCFTIIDCGAAGRESDGGVFSRSAFGKRYIENNLDFPASNATLPGTHISVPFMCVADAAFPLRTNLMKPFGGKSLSRKQMVFNYRLSRCRRTIENAFGILAARWRFLRRTVIATPERVGLFVRTACILHNFLQKGVANDSSSKNLYCPLGFADTYAPDGSVIAGLWRTDEPTNFQLPLTNVPPNRYGSSAGAIRETLASYFVSETGSVTWQDKIVFATH